MPCHKLRGKAESKRHSMIRGKMYLTVLVLCFVLKKSRTVFTLCVCGKISSHVVLILLSTFFFKQSNNLKISIFNQYFSTMLVYYSRLSG